MGDIKELCKMVMPEYGVITGICAQHLETFVSVDNILKEKGVLASYAKKVVLGRSAAQIPAEEKLVEEEDFAAEEIVLKPDGTEFRLRLKDETIDVKTELLGRSAAEDIALAAALGVTLGMSAEEIAEGIKNIKPVPHRLERSEANGVTILDDSYNCNEEGARCAVEVLKLFGENRWIVTPGIVELGALEYNKNRALGENARASREKGIYRRRGRQGKDTNGSHPQRRAGATCKGIAKRRYRALFERFARYLRTLKSD